MKTTFITHQSVEKTFDRLVYLQKEFLAQQAISELSIGTTFQQKMRTKLSIHETIGQGKVTRFIDNEIIEFELKFPTGTTLQTYRFERIPEGCKILFSEVTTYHKLSLTINQRIMSLLWRPLQQRTFKKRMQAVFY